jgi:hypothetical protein
VFFRKIMAEPRFTIQEEISRQYRSFNAVGTQFTARLSPSVDSNTMYHFLASVSDLCEHALQNCNNSDVVEITISNEENVQEKAIGISFRRRV